MKRKILTLQKVPTPQSCEQSVVVQAGKKSNKGNPANTRLIELLQELVGTHCRVFIQMRHGTGYCGIPSALQDGWLTLQHVSIHGTKQMASAPSILIQINDGSYIAHVHPTVSNTEGATA